MADELISVRAELIDHLSKELEGVRKQGERTFIGPRGLEKVAKQAAKGLAVLSVAAGAVVFAVVRMTMKVAEDADKLLKLSDRLGTTVEGMSELRFVAERAGITFETLTMSFQRMSRRVNEAGEEMGEASSALEELQINARELAKLKPEEQFEVIAEALFKLENQGTRLRLAFKLFDSEGVTLLQTMTKGAKGIREMRAEARRLGLTISTEFAQKAAKFNDAMTDIKAQTTGVKLAIAEALLPTLTDLGDKLKEIGQSEDFQKGIQSGADAVGNMATAVISFVEWVGRNEDKLTLAVVAVGALTGAAALRGKGGLIGAGLGAAAGGLLALNTVEPEALQIAGIEAKIAALEAGRRFGVQGGGLTRSFGLQGISPAVTLFNRLTSSDRPSGVDQELTILRLQLRGLRGDVGLNAPDDTADFAFGDRQRSAKPSPLAPSVGFGIAELLKTMTSEEVAAKIGIRLTKLRDPRALQFEPQAFERAGGDMSRGLNAGFRAEQQADARHPFVNQGMGQILNALSRGREPLRADTLKAGEGMGDFLTEGLNNSIRGGGGGDDDELNNVGEFMGNAIRQGLFTELTFGFEDLLTGDENFTSVLENLGSGMVTSIIVGISDEFAGQIVQSELVTSATNTASKWTGEFIKQVGTFTDPSVIWEAVKPIGAEISKGIHSALDIKIPATFADSFGPEGSVGKTAAEGFGRAIRGAVVGLAIGTIIGDDIAAKAAMIGGAFGDALAGPVGGIIGAISGAALSKIPLVSGVIDKLFGISKKKDVEELGLDIRAFGGVTGFFERIGGFEGIKGTRAETIATKEGGDALRKAIRISVGATREQAFDVVDILRKASERDTGFLFVPGGFKSSIDQTKNILRKLGFSEDDIARVGMSVPLQDAPIPLPPRAPFELRRAFGVNMPPQAPVPILPPQVPIDPRPGAFALDPGVDVGGGVPPSITDPGGHAQGSADVDAATEMLRGFIQMRTLSAHGLSFWGVEIIKAATKRIGDNAARIFPITALLAGGTGKDDLPGWAYSAGYDIVARQGVNTVVTRPTRVLVGEGPLAERLTVTPIGGGSDTMQADGGGNVTMNVYVTIHALDGASVRRQVQGEFGDMMIERMKQVSELRRNTVFDTGVVQTRRV